MIETRIDEWGNVERLTASHCLNCHKPERSEGPGQCGLFLEDTAATPDVEVSPLVCLFKCSLCSVDDQGRAAVGTARSQAHV